MSVQFTNTELLSEVFSIIRKSRQKAEFDAEERRLQLCLTSIDFANIDIELRETGKQIYAILSNGQSIKEKMSLLASRNLDLQQKRSQFLSKKNYPKDYLTPNYTCKTCCDTGYVNGEYCQCIHEHYRRLSAKKINESSPLRLSTFDTYNLNYVSLENNARVHMDNVLTYLMRYADTFSQNSKSLYFYGSTGLGKTHLSLALANAVSATGKNVIYCSAPAVFQQIADERFDRVVSDGTEKSMIECDLLVIDDLGSEMITQLSQSILYNIVNSRILLNRPTVISSNIDIKELDNFYHERTVSRIAFSYDMIPFMGKDVRQVLKHIENMQNN